MNIFLKQKKGITLIALVITIIVLLILAGISISMLSGDNSILQKATDAKKETEKSQIIENAQTDILGQQAENKGNNITKGQLAEILNKQFQTITIDEIPDEVSADSEDKDIELTTKDGKYKIYLSEMFVGNLNTEGNEDTITFYIRSGSINLTCEAKEGMTFKQWIATYSPENFSESGEMVQYLWQGRYRELLTAPGLNYPSVFLNDPIIKDAVYGAFNVDD